MPRGGRRFGQDRPVVPPARVPRPPRSVVGPEREAWLELAPQIEAAGTYTAADYTALRLAVRALAAVYAAPADLKPGTLRGLLENASKLIGRFGLDPIARGQIRMPERDDEEEDELAEFLEARQ